jgi:hypothetical protein
MGANLLIQNFDKANRNSGKEWNLNSRRSA